MRVFLIRHGRPSQTWGGAGSDPGLSEIGAAQAEAAAEMLRRFGPLDVVSSPMLRCRETAAPYARWRGLPPVLERRVSEIVADDGVEDRAVWLQTRFPWREARPGRTWTTLEPRLHEWRAEMLEFIRSLRADTAVFTHFIGINVITGAAMGREETIVCRPDHASITVIAVDDGALRLVALGATMQIDDVR
ncbi:MAG: histidine phosphatase family protein [Hyphomonadaceae bacterium]